MTEPTRNFRQALREADHIMAEAAVPPSVWSRIDASLAPADRQQQRRSWWPVAGLTAAAVVAVVALALAPDVRDDGAGTPSPPDQLAGLTVVSQSADFAALASEQSVSVRAGHAVLHDDEQGVELSVTAGARLTRTAAGARLDQGTVVFIVAERHARSHTYTLAVSHGVIEVLGTHFTVVQRVDGGSVDLHEGSIRFSPGEGGAPILLRPGQSHAWPSPHVLPAGTSPARPQPTQAVPQKPPAVVTATALRTTASGQQEPQSAKPVQAPRRAKRAPRRSGSATPAAPAAPAVPQPSRSSPAPEAAPTPAPKSAPKSAPKTVPAPVEAAPLSSAELLQQVASLRSRGRYGEAVKLLRRGSRRRFGPGVAARLSYELGSLLTWQIKSPKRACAHWVRHRKRFAGGRYKTDIASAVRHLRCPAAAPTSGDPTP